VAPNAGTVLHFFNWTELQKMIRKAIYSVLLFTLVWSCAKEPVETVFFHLNTEKGVFISCEGNFMYGNASLSFYNPENKRVQNQLFYARNNAPLGDVAQSLTLFENTLFVVVNNSGKIYAIDPETAEFKGVISGLTSPRYIHIVSDSKAYISDLYAHHITIFNPVTYEITGQIVLPEEHTLEQMVQVGKYVYSNSWSYDEYLLKIDTETDKIVDKLKVPYQPKNLAVDKNEKIWILSGGDVDGILGESQQPALTRIDPLTFTIEQIYSFEEESQPSGLELNTSSDTLYFINNGIFKMSINQKNLPDSSFISAENELFYSLGVNPKNNEIYVSDAIDYTQNAIIYRYSKQGMLIDSFLVDINPSDFLFR
jgi:hypothetical protein